MSDDPINDIMREFNIVPDPAVKTPAVGRILKRDKSQRPENASCVRNPNHNGRQWENPFEDRPDIWTCSKVCYDIVTGIVDEHPRHNKTIRPDGVFCAYNKQHNGVFWHEITLDNGASHWVCSYWCEMKLRDSLELFDVLKGK